MKHNSGLTSTQAHNAKGWMVEQGSPALPYSRGIRYTTFGIVAVLDAQIGTQTKIAYLLLEMVIGRRLYQQRINGPHSEREIARTVNQFALDAFRASEAGHDYK